MDFPSCLGCAWVVRPRWLRMRSNNVVILIVAVLLGGAAAVLARNWLVSHAQSSSATTMVVAAAPLAYGVQLTAENVTEISWSAGEIPEGTFASKRDLLKDGRRMTLAAIARKEPSCAAKSPPPGSAPHFRQPSIRESAR